MKTRIKIVEYNSGKKEFICQEDNFSWVLFFKLFISIIGTVPSIVLIFARDWTTMYYYKLNEKTQAYIYSRAVFDTEEEAKKFIDNWILKQEAKKKQQFEEKIKKTHYQKYP